MLLNCGVGEDFWESLGLQGDPTSSYFGHLMRRTHSLEDSDAGKDWRQEKGTTEDERVGWHPQFYGHESEKALGVGDRHEAWRAAVHGVTKSWTWLSNWTEQSPLAVHLKLSQYCSLAILQNKINTSKGKKKNLQEKMTCFSFFRNKTTSEVQPSWGLSHFFTKFVRNPSFNFSSLSHLCGL